MSVDERTPEELDRPTMLEAVLSTAEGNCNVLAGQAALEAERFFDENATEPAEYTFLPDGSFVLARAAEILSVPQETSERSMTLNLIKPEYREDDIGHPMYLAVVTRENLVLPLASFARRDDHCDFVQIGDDMQKLIVVHGDEQVADPVDPPIDLTAKENREILRVRMEVLESIREAITYPRPEVEEKPPTELELGYRHIPYAGMDSPLYANWIGDSLRCRRLGEGLVMKDEGIELTAAYLAGLERLQSTATLLIYPQNKRSGAARDIKSFSLEKLLIALPDDVSARVVALKNTYLGLLKQFPYESINSGHIDLYSALLSPYVRAGDEAEADVHARRVINTLTEAEAYHSSLLREAQYYFNNNRWRQPKPEGSIPTDWMEKLGVKAQLDKLLGKHNPAEEEVIAHARELAQFGGEVVMRQVGDLLGFKKN